MSFVNPSNLNAPGDGAFGAAVEIVSSKPQLTVTDSNADSTNKNCSINLNHYDTSEEGISLIRGTSNASSTTLWHGYDSNLNAPTIQRFLVTPDNTTVGSPASHQVMRMAHQQVWIGVEPSALGTFTVYGQDAADEAAVVRAASGQTVDTFRVENNAGTSQLAVDEDGVVNIGAHLNQQTSTAADPTTTDYPTDKDFGVHKNTTSGNVYLAYNDGGTIKKVQLT